MQNSDFSSQVQTDNPSSQNQHHLDIVVSQPGELVSQPQDRGLIQPLSPHPHRLHPLVILSWGLVGIGAIALSVWTWQRWQYVTSFEETKNAYITSDITAINARVSGNITQVSIPANQQVKKGTLLIQINPQQYQTQLKRVEANLRQAQAALSKSQQQQKLAQTQLQNLCKQTSISSVQLNKVALNQNKNIQRIQAISQQLYSQLRKLDPIFLQAELDYNRFQKLNQQGFISLPTLIKTKAYYDRLEIQRRQILQKWQQVQAQLVAANLNLLDNQIQATQTKIENLSPPQPQTTQPSANISAEKQKYDREKQNFITQIEQLTAKKTLVKQTQKINEQTYTYEVSKLQVKIAQNIITKLQKQHKTAKYQLASTKITAPIQGKIGITQVEVGQKVKPGQTLISLIPESRWIAAHFRQEQLKNIKPGQPVQIKINNLENLVLPGKVKKIPNQNKNQNPQKLPGIPAYLTPPVKITFDQSNLKQNKISLIPGASVAVKVKIKE